MTLQRSKEKVEVEFTVGSGSRSNDAGCAAFHNSSLDDPILNPPPDSEPLGYWQQICFHEVFCRGLISGCFGGFVEVVILLPEKVPVA